MPWEYAKISLSTPHSKEKRKLKVGWFSLYPPFPNGVAVMTKHVVNELMQNEDVELFAIPYNNKIDKQLFKGIQYAKVNSSFLDVVIFYSVTREYAPLNVKTMVWHTIHSPFNEEKQEVEDFNTMKSADLLVAPTKMALREFKKAGAKNAVYIPEGIPLEQYAFLSKEKENLAIFVSRNHYYKGVMPFLETAEIILQENKEWKFSLHAPTDKNSPYLEEVFTKIDDLKRKYPKNFSFDKHWLEDKKIKSLYKRAKILIFPSNNEGFGIPLVEAMASGCIPLTSDKEPMNELVQNKKTGFCFALKKQYHEFLFPDPKEMAEKIKQINEDKTLYRNMAKAAVKRAEEYDATKTAKRFVEEAKKLVNVHE